MTETEFNWLLKYGKRTDNINGELIQVNQLPFCYIKWEFANLIKTDIITATKKGLDYLEIDYKYLDSRELKSIFLYLYDEILTKEGLIYHLEETYLKNVPDPDMIASGQHRLNDFNNLLTLYNLANEDVLKIDEVSKQPYQFLLDVQVMKKIQGEIQSNYHKIISNKKR